MSDSWLSGVQRLRIPRPKMTVTSRDRTVSSRPADPPQDYSLSDVEEVDMQSSQSCCKNFNNNNNNTNNNNSNNINNSNKKNSNNVTANFS